MMPCEDKIKPVRLRLKGEPNNRPGSLTAGETRQQLFNQSCWRNQNGSARKRKRSRLIKIQTGSRTEPTGDRLDKQAAEAATAAQMSGDKERERAAAMLKPHRKNNEGKTTQGINA